MENIFSRKRLTPARIKIWISLLSVISTWTLLTVYLLFSAQQVEVGTRNVVHSLNDKLVSSDLSRLVEVG